ncbi:Na+/H+ antiporter subunit A [Pseudonocardia hydrocarbonoxydans]|uniref:Na+/H+ antiporter subunit A n=1 Tax=Pseudonocardia hydrocarbonoxydans TaxID=76726 RepID=A0A4Y3WUL7_9PSEU|nr:hydrogen gas-evolving membrane-bound hydrogenase subunit E [Pseudonocardia hydrocarbonoxydans]GEC21056.1 Na+/H+ antiporter subunit A [Pseudonocardia hydrocarbonoxydans]
MLALVVAHLVVALLLPLVSVRSHRTAFLVAAVLPALTLVWALAQSGVALGPGLAETTPWAPSLGLELSFRLDALALAMIVLVSGLGAVILVYSAGYFGPTSEEATRSAALVLTFAGVMLGLVLADDLLTLYVFWELTSITSYLLVGQRGEKRESRRAALQALLVTVLGGLSMLLGFVLLGEAAGTYRISEILADPPRGGMVPVALLLILLGAFTKSAQLPFHPWLPAAMVAPTPVSAYLHAASMVKAGVYLVARLSPAFADLAVWWVPVVAVGIGTMVVGGWRALAETDLKRVLAFGTVSQLGFLMVLFGAGGRIAALAGIGMLLAHGLFKAPLFMIVGVIDHATGTRDLRRLSGLRHSMPGVAAAGVLAAASMAGLPPLIGFVGKETAFAAFLDEGDSRSWAIALGLLAGSVLTAAYSARFVWGAFGAKAGKEPTPVHHAPGPLLTAPVWLCVVGGLALGLAAPVVDALAAGYADRYVPADAEQAGYEIALWHGLGLPLLFSAIAIGGGLLLHRHRKRVRTLAYRSPFSAQNGYENTVAGLERVAVVVTGRSQVGSLPAYLATILVVVVVLLAPATLAGGAWPADQVLYHEIAQVPLGIAVVVAAIAVVRERRRFTAVLLVGVIGYGVGGLFVVDGAPDLALAQFLVETLSLVAFVFVLRRLPSHFTEQPSPRRSQVFKAVLAGVGGIVVAGVAVVLSGARVAPSSTSGQFVALAPEGAGADNVIAAILVDFRALDTVGEIGVLFVAAAGVASLVLATRYDRGRDSGQGTPRHEKDVLG